MKTIYWLLGLFIFISSCDNKKQGTKDFFTHETAKMVMERAMQQYENMMKELPDDKLPRTTNGKDSLITSGSAWWTSGFYPGSLWYLYEYSGNEIYKTEAQEKMLVVEKEKLNTGTHDLGFMLYCSFGNAYRLLANEEYKNVLLMGAESLSTRFNPNVGSIKSWDHTGNFPVIIDNMMNLELLFWATKISGDSVYHNIAVSHADTTIKNHFRDDYSSWHVIHYDPENGQIEEKITSQGYSDSSAWARGQAWGLYGYTMSFRETGIERYLNQAENIADYILNHPNLPTDKVPYWDFNDPEIPDTYRDASAGAIIASALLELSRYVENNEKAKNYQNSALDIMLTLSQDRFLAEEGTNGNFLLKHSVGSIPHNSEVDVPLTYADYYYIEAIMRYIDMRDNGMLN
jgi:hypothetical protein